MEDLKTALENALRRAPKLKDSKIELENAALGKVGGFIISGSFDGMSQIDRQDLVWAHIEKELESEVQMKIMSLLTLTPEEVEDDEDIEGERPTSDGSHSSSPGG